LPSIIAPDSRWRDGWRRDPKSSGCCTPRWESDPGHAIWQRDFTGASGLFSIVLKPAPQKSIDALLDTVKLFGMGYSWGGFESLAISCDHQLKTRTLRPDYGGPLIRLHIGLENADDLIADLERGLAIYARTGRPGVSDSLEAFIAEEGLPESFRRTVELVCEPLAARAQRRIGTPGMPFWRDLAQIFIRFKYLLEKSSAIAPVQVDGRAVSTQPINPTQAAAKLQAIAEAANTAQTLGGMFPEEFKMNVDGRKSMEAWIKETGTGDSPGAALGR